MTEILMKHVFCALWMALITPLSMANAAPLDASDARFQEVVDIWLSGQEMEALQSLADMAREGHVSAKDPAVAHRQSPPIQRPHKR